MPTPASRTQILCALLVLFTTGCTKTVFHHATIASASATPGTLGFGLGRTSSETRSMLGRSSFDDTRVEHAAGTSADGTRDRFWRVRVPETMNDPLGALTQTLELCDGTPSSPGRCMDATVADSTGALVGMPTLLETVNFGASARFTAARTSSVTWVTAEGAVRTPSARPSTPALGVWIVARPMSQMTLFGLGPSTGELYFCHAPVEGAPTCRAVTGGFPAVSRVLGIHVLDHANAPRHVVWYQGRDAGTLSTLSRPMNTVVRCEADDQTADIRCQTTEVTP